MAMRIENGKFKNRIQDGIDDSFMRGAVAKAQNNLLDRRLQVADELGNWEKWRENSEQIRIHTLEFLDYYLMQLSENVTKRGGHVFFAKTKEDASKYIQEVIKKKEATKIVKSKSMVTEEISLNQALEEIGCEILETDLGEYILQLDDHNPPSHIVTPALHLNKEQIRDVFVEKLGYTGTTDPYEMAKFIRAILRKKFMEAEVGITGCNFAVANTGSISLVTNEGNAELSTMMPKTHIAVMGMERVVPTLEELEVLVGMLCRSAVGQTLTSYISVLTGPKEFGDVDGPEDFHLVIVDNGRSEILGTEFQSILQCIRCGACINVCPVYRHIGGHSYGSIYPGPIGAVLSPLLGGYDDFKELPFASSLCGACTDACPVKIPLHNLLVEHRKVIVEKVGSSPIHEKVTMKAINKVISSPKLYKSATKYASVASIPFKKDDSIQRGVGLLKGWTDIRNFPAPEKERLRDWFEKRKRREEK